MISRETTYSIDELGYAVPNERALAEATPQFQNAYTQAIDPNVIGTNEQGQQLKNIGIRRTEVTVKVGDDIQAALDKVNELGGGIVNLLAGTHTSGSLLVYSNTTLRGVSPDSTVLSLGSSRLEIEGGSGGGFAEYTTGTVTGITAGVTVTGSGTSWDGNVFPGENLRLGNRWYTIASVDSDTQLTLAEGYTGSVSFPTSYRITTVATDIVLENFKIISTNSQRSVLVSDVRKISLKNFQVFSNTNADGILLSNTQECSMNQILVVGNVDDGIQVVGGALYDWSSVNCISNGRFGISLISCEAISMIPIVCISNSSTGIVVDSSEDIIILAEASNNGADGIFVDDNSSGIVIFNGTIEDNTSDGIEINATSDQTRIIGNQITGNGAYGIDVQASTNDDTIIIGNHFGSNTSGAVNDAGTGTLIRGNTGVDDNKTSITTPLVVSAASYTTDTGTALNMDDLDMFVITAQAGALLFNAPGGTLTEGRSLVIRIKDDGTARALTWNAVFRAMGTPLPSTTVATKTLYLTFRYNTTDTKWDLLHSAQET